MRRGWQVELNDGTILEETSTKWKDVPKINIKTLSLLYDGRRWDLSGKQAYFIRNKASLVPGIASSFRIERRCIGYYEGAKKVLFVIDEHSGKFHLEVVEDGEA